MNTISIDEFKKIYTEGNVKLLIDVRTPAEFEEVHVKGATNLPLGDLNLQKIEQLCSKAATFEVYLICRSGGRSQKALEKLCSLGFQHAISIVGGTQAAETSGLPVIKSERKIMSLERQVRITAGTLIIIGTLGAMLVSNLFLFITLFVGAGLVFAGITDWCGMGLLLAKFPWNNSKLSCSN